MYLEDYEPGRVFELETVSVTEDEILEFGRSYDPQPESSLGSPGIDELRFVAPVRPDDVLAVTVTVLENRPSKSKPDRGIIRSQVRTTNQDGVIVLTMIAINLIRARP